MFWIDAERVTSLDWKTYPILKLTDVTDLGIVLINWPKMEAPTAGEASSIPVPAAIANAISDATAARLCEVPFTPERFLAALKSKPATSQRRPGQLPLAWDSQSD